MSKIGKFVASELIHKSGNNIFFSPNPKTILNLSRIDRITQKEDEIIFTIRGEFEYSSKYSFEQKENAVAIMDELRKVLSTEYSTNLFF